VIFTVFKAIDKKLMKMKKNKILIILISTIIIIILIYKSNQNK
jgi:hypothetical protein